MDRRAIIDITRRWIEFVVIELNLCPFARRVFEGGLIHYVVADVADEESLRAVLADELRLLASTPLSTIETTILIHPNVSGDFLKYNDFLAEADRLIRELKLHGTIQIASFHPDYQFEGTAPNAVENYSNRSPFPMLHLLREESITKVASDEEELLKIPQKNIETLRKLGNAEILRRLRAVKGDAARE